MSDHAAGQQGTNTQSAHLAQHNHYPHNWQDEWRGQGKTGLLSEVQRLNVERLQRQGAAALQIKGARTALPHAYLPMMAQGGTAAVHPQSPCSSLHHSCAKGAQLAPALLSRASARWQGALHCLAYVRA